MNVVDVDNTIYFYGIYDEYYCFSNFYKCGFNDENLTYNCSEQYFMKKKQEQFDPENDNLANDIMKTDSPAQIKKFGRMVKNYDENEWNKKRFNYMCDAIYLKFSQNIELKNILISTDNKILVEASPYDKIWGIGISPEDAKKGKKWNGQNLLGLALMKVRSIIMSNNIELNS